MKSRVSVIMLLVVGFVCGVMFVMSCGSGGGSSAVALAGTDMTGVETRLDQLITINNQLLTMNSQILSRIGGTVNPSNHAPIAVATAISTCVVAGSENAMLSGSSSSDSDGDLLMYKWQFVTMPYGSTAKINDPAIVNPWFAADVPGSYVVRLTVSDGSPSLSTNTITIVAKGSCP
jgi:hypothetical protein